MPVQLKTELLARAITLENQIDKASGLADPTAFNLRPVDDGKLSTVLIQGLSIVDKWKAVDYQLRRSPLSAIASADFTADRVYPLGLKAFNDSGRHSYLCGFDEDDKDMMLQIKQDLCGISIVKRKPKADV